MPRWKPTREDTVLFDHGEDQRYAAVAKRLREGSAATPGPAVTSAYPMWPHLVGRGKHGEFPLAVAAAHYRKQGYSVWFCEPALEQYDHPDFVGFMLVSYPGRRRQRVTAYCRMLKAFGEAAVEALNRVADRKKRGMNDGTGTPGGGDPDLFVFNDHERFFVEVKWKDQLTAKQLVTFPLIEQHCGVPVRLARLQERPA